MKLLITHRAPDIDAITALWMFKRFQTQEFGDAKFAFIDAGSRMSDQEIQALGFDKEDVVHVDTGLGEFDHHQPEFGGKRICAASLVYDFVAEAHPEVKQDWALQQIVEYALVDDHFENFNWPESKEPRYLFGFRGVLQGLEYAGLHNDESQVAFGCKFLDGVYAALRLRHRAMKEMEEKGVEFSSRWGRSLGVLSANNEVIRYAQLAGYTLVIQKDPHKGNIRLKTAPLPELDLTCLYEKIQEKDKKGRWYFHPSKHMLLNGSTRARHAPSPLTLDETIALAKSCET